MWWSSGTFDEVSRLRGGTFPAPPAAVRPRVLERLRFARFAFSGIVLQFRSSSEHKYNHSKYKCRRIDVRQSLTGYHGGEKEEKKGRVYY